MQITGINGIGIFKNTKAIQQSPATNSIKNVQNAQFISKEYSQASKLNALNLAKTVSFTGALISAFEELNNAMVTCKSKESGGEVVGSKASVNRLLEDFEDDLGKPGDAIKTTIMVNEDDYKKEQANKAAGKEYKNVQPKYARTQIKLLDPDKQTGSDKMLFQMVVRNSFTRDDDSEPIQMVDIEMCPEGSRGTNTKEQAYVLNTKGNLMPVVEDGNLVLLTDAGEFTKRSRYAASSGQLHVNATKAGNVYKKFKPLPLEKDTSVYGPSIGEGTEIVIGMENGRFVNEIKDSIKTFVKKVQNGEIKLPQFVAAENAKDTQLVMLAGGFGSRAEYTNAASSAIFHNEDGGSQSTKGVFRTPTGLTPMETTFVTLHKAGLLDCSPEKLSYTGPNANIKFYLNKCGNKGNGGYTIGLADKMNREGRKQIMIFPNDSMSRLTTATIEANKLTREGKAAIAIIAKEVLSKDCINTFGIMQIDKKHGNEIVAFKEKPKTIDKAFIYSEDKNGNDLCLTNTFQFSVSNEALEVLSMFEPFFSKTSKGKETRDWSKNYIPIIQAVTQYAKPNLAELADPYRYTQTVEKLVAYETAKKNLAENVFSVSVADLNDAGFDEVFAQAKSILGNQKLVAVPTGEPWADCGTLNAMSHTIMEIVYGSDFKLENFERENALKCVNPTTGLITTSPQIKRRIENKYDINGQVMVVEKAKKIKDKDVADIPVVVNKPVKA